jgi:flagellar motor switch protein FliN
MAKTKEKKKPGADKQREAEQTKSAGGTDAVLTEEEMAELEGLSESNGIETPADEADGTPETGDAPVIGAEFSMQAAEFQNLKGETAEPAREAKLDLLMDLSLPVSIELGRTNLLIKDILNLQRGSIVEFEKLASEPVDILINGKKMAEGEVVVIEKHFGIRITNLINATDRIKSLGR